MRGGSSINNMMNGDAEKSLLTLADLKTGTPEEKKRRARRHLPADDQSYFIDADRRSGYLGTHSARCGSTGKTSGKDVQPRLNRLHHGYPLVRAAVHDVHAGCGRILVIAGYRPRRACYLLPPGRVYDEVAHHTGPSTDAAFHILSKYDRTIGRIADVITRKAPRPYDLIVLSDHGQSFGATFSQRYGFSLTHFIEQHLPAGCGAMTTRPAATTARIATGVAVAAN